MNKLQIRLLPLLILASIFVTSLGHVFAAPLDGSQSLDLAALNLPTRAVQKRVYKHGETGLDAMRKALPAGTDQGGYSWTMPNPAHSNYHISLILFQPAAYTQAHVDSLEKVLAGSSRFLPAQGHFYRPELWLREQRADGSLSYVHYVDPRALTRNETQALATKSYASLYDPAVRSLDSLDRTKIIAEGLIILRYGTDGELSDEIDKALRKLATSHNADQTMLESNRIDYGNNHLIAHLTYARVFRAQGTQYANKQNITGGDVEILKNAFKKFQDKYKPLNYTMQEIHLTSGNHGGRRTEKTIRGSSAGGASHSASASSASASAAKPAAAKPKTKIKAGKGAATKSSKKVSSSGKKKHNGKQEKKPRPKKR